MAVHAQLKFVMRECSKTQIHLTGLTCTLFVLTYSMKEKAHTSIRVVLFTVNCYLCKLFKALNLAHKQKKNNFFVLMFYDQVITIKVMSSRSINLSTLFLGRLPKLTSTKCPYFLPVFDNCPLETAVGREWL